MYKKNPLCSNTVGKPPSITQQLPGEPSVIHRPELYAAVHRLLRLVTQGYNSWHDNKVPDREEERPIPWRACTLDKSICKWWDGLSALSSFYWLTTLVKHTVWLQEESFSGGFSDVCVFFGCFLQELWKEASHLKVLPFEAALLSFSSRSAPCQLKIRERNTE